MMTNPQIKITFDKNDFNEIMKENKPTMLIMNHSSMFDFFIVSASLPLKFILKSHPRTVMSSSLANVPFFGKMISKHSGSFLVYFKAKGAGFGKGDASDYSVDKTLQLKENEEMDRHLDQGGE